MEKLLLIFIGGLLVLSACGGKDISESETQSNQNVAEEANTITINATNFSFDQEEYVVMAGEPATIRFTAKEGMHGIGIDEFNVKIQGDGTATFTPEEPGEYRIYCNIPCGSGHAEMVSTLIVQ